LNLRKGEFHESVWIRGESKQTPTGLSRRPILGSQAQHARNQHSKGITRFLGDDADDGLLPLADFSPKDAKRGMNFFIPHGS
jgi:hypothetical protein